eukprot:GHVU01234609.1.p1 GENE.GHVU01234609.1~~GHVU01234609.1.p1  ORF type:complete len:187 (-),score=36.20 GHVU01234609.1:527-1087(-)
MGGGDVTHRVRFSVDRGGTFTDVYAEEVLHAGVSAPGLTRPDLETEKADAPSALVTRRRVLKLLSEAPQHYDDSAQEAIRRIIAEWYPEASAASACRQDDDAAAASRRHGQATIATPDHRNHYNEPSDLTSTATASKSPRRHDDDDDEKMKKVDASRIEWIRMGTTVATNALLQRRGVPFALLTTE